MPIRKLHSFLCALAYEMYSSSKVVRIIAILYSVFSSILQQETVPFANRSQSSFFRPLPKEGKACLILRFAGDRHYANFFIQYYLGIKMVQCVGSIKCDLCGVNCRGDWSFMTLGYDSDIEV